MTNPILQLETSKICNIKCSFCYKSSENYTCKTVEKPFMTLSEVKNWVYKKNFWDKIILFNNGEFFVNTDWKNIFEFVIKHASNYSQTCEILINTNTVLLDNDSADFIINTVKNSNVILRITFSINAYSAEVYKKFTSKDLRNRVYENAENFIIKVKKYQNIYVSPQIIVMKENFNEITEFVTYWADFFEKNDLNYSVCEDTYTGLNNRFNIFIRRFNSACIIEDDLFEKAVLLLDKKYDVKINTTLKYEDGKDFFKRRVCKFVFENGVFSGDKHVLCCRDINQELTFTGIKECDDVLRDFYISNHLTGNFENMSPCILCSHYEIADSNTIEKNFLTNQNKILYNNRLEKGTGFDFYTINCDKESFEFAAEFLKQNSLYVLCNDKFESNQIYKGKYSGKKIPSKDICAGWKLELNIENKKIYAGCSKIKYEITDFQNYQNALKHGDFSKIPASCILCDEKYVYNKLTDRFNIVANNTFYSPVTPSNKKYEILKQIEKNINIKNFEQIENILKRENKIYYYFKLIAYANSAKITDNPEYYNIIEKTDNYFLFDYMIENKEKDFEKSFVYLIQKFKILPGVKNILRIFDVFFEKKYNNSYVEKLCNKFLNIIQNPETDFKNSANYNFIAKENYFIEKMIEKFKFRSVWFVEKDMWNDFLKIYNIAQNKKNILKAVNFNIISKIENKKYYNITNILKNLTKTDLELTDTIDLIFKTDFDFYNERFLKLLLWLQNFSKQTDRGVYLVYSYYMKTEKFDSALKFFHKLEKPLDKFTKKDYINTEIYLYQKTGKKSKALMAKIKSKFKQGID